MPAFSEQDFACTITANEIREKLFPVLDQIAGQEFLAILHPGLPVDDTDITDVAFSVKKMGAIICEYIKQLSQMHIRFAVQYAELENCTRDGGGYGQLDNLLNSQTSEVFGG